MPAITIIEENPESFFPLAISPIFYIFGIMNKIPTAFLLVVFKPIVVLLLGQILTIRHL
ncbi:hypothetical protein BSPWISOXPB_11122 [uncultured Gammaproteobacteria bacterium]|nr:hypothetical protein BSPWISOXPB_11122 [uncultured Gammaproteobacteria bacterium]